MRTISITAIAVMSAMTLADAANATCNLAGRTSAMGGAQVPATIGNITGGPVTVYSVDGTGRAQPMRNLAAGELWNFTSTVGHVFAIQDGAGDCKGIHTVQTNGLAVAVEVSSGAGGVQAPVAAVVPGVSGGPAPTPSSPVPSAPMPSQNVQAPAPADPFGQGLQALAQGLLGGLMGNQPQQMPQPNAQPASPPMPSPSVQGMASSWPSIQPSSPSLPSSSIQAVTPSAQPASPALLPASPSVSPSLQPVSPPVSPQLPAPSTQMAMAAPQAPAPQQGTAAPGGFAGVILAAHNAMRAEHGAAPMTWSPDIARTAQAWVDSLKPQGCQMQHSNASDPRFRYPGAGENMYVGTQKPNPGQDAADSWYWCEIDKYDAAQPGFSPASGHYTQVIWKGSTQLGCAVARCSPSEQTIFPGMGLGVDLVACQYGPAGNMMGTFPQNVAHRQRQRPPQVTCF